MKGDDRVAREDIKDNDPRLGGGWSQWLPASSSNKPVDFSLLSSKLPKEAGLYEWCFVDPKTSKKTVVYLGKAEGKDGLHQRIQQYSFGNKHKTMIMKQAHEAGLQAMVRYRTVGRTTRSTTVVGRAREQETAALSRIDYSLNLDQNGKREARQPKGISEDVLDVLSVERRRRSARLAAKNQSRTQQAIATGPLHRSSKNNARKSNTTLVPRKDGKPDRHYKQSSPPSSSSLPPPTAKSSGGVVLRKDGKPDRRYKQPSPPPASTLPPPIPQGVVLRKDGKPDRRYNQPATKVLPPVSLLPPPTLPVTKSPQGVILRKDGQPDQRYKQPTTIPLPTTVLRKDGQPDRRYNQPTIVPSPTVVLRKDGQPDRRYKQSQPSTVVLRRDGLPDRRYKLFGCKPNDYYSSFGGGWNDDDGWGGGGGWGGGPLRKDGMPDMRYKCNW